MLIRVTPNKIINTDQITLIDLNYSPERNLINCEVKVVGETETIKMNKAVCEYLKKNSIIVG